MANKDRIKGKADKAKRKLKEEYGKANDNPNKQREDQTDRDKGKVREYLGKAKDKRRGKR